MLRSIVFDNFEGFANNDIVGYNNTKGWTTINMNGYTYFIASTTTPIEGNISLAQQPDAGGVDGLIEYVATELVEGGTSAYELRFIHQNTASALNLASAKPFKVYVANSDGEHPWKIEIYKDAVRVEDNGGVSANLFNPGTTLHTYRMTDDGAGNIELFIDGGSEHTGVPIAITPTGVDRVRMFQKEYASFADVGRIDMVNLLQVVPSTYNVAKIFVGK